MQYFLPGKTSNSIRQPNRPLQRWDAGVNVDDGHHMPVRDRDEEEVMAVGLMPSCQVAWACLALEMWWSSSSRRAHSPSRRTHISTGAMQVFVISGLVGTHLEASGLIQLDVGYNPSNNGQLFKLHQHLTPPYVMLLVRNIYHHDNFNLSLVMMIGDLKE